MPTILNGGLVLLLLICAAAFVLARVEHDRQIARRRTRHHVHPDCAHAPRRAA